MTIKHETNGLTLKPYNGDRYGFFRMGIPEIVTKWKTKKEQIKKHLKERQFLAPLF